MQIRFGPFSLDLDTRQLIRAQQAIHLSPKAFELLAALVHERPAALSKADLQQRLWPDTFVVEANLSNLIAEVRAALEEDARAPQFIRTVHGFGYAFFAEALTLPAAHDRRADRPQGWIQWGDRRFPLVVGSHVVGRDPDVEVRLDGTTVSRRHAQLVVTTEGVVLEDFGSKNGTYRNADRVTTPVALKDGDEIRIGSVLVTFHLRGSAPATETQVSNAS